MGNINNSDLCAAKLVHASRTSAQQLEAVSNKVQRVFTRKRVGGRRVLTPARDSEDPGSWTLVQVDVAKSSPRPATVIHQQAAPSECAVISPGTWSPLLALPNIPIHIQNLFAQLPCDRSCRTTGSPLSTQQPSRPALGPQRQQTRHGALDDQRVIAASFCFLESWSRLFDA